MKFGRNPPLSYQSGREGRIGASRPIPARLRARSAVRKQNVAATRCNWQDAPKTVVRKPRKHRRHPIS